MEELRLLVQNLIPLFEAKKRNWTDEQIQRSIDYGWIFCVLGNCEPNESATDSMFTIDEYKRHCMSEHREWLRNEEIRKNTRTRIYILHNEVGSAQPNPDASIEPLVELSKLAVKMAKRKQLEAEERGLNQTMKDIPHCFVCLEGCNLIKYSCKTKEHMAEVHGKELSEIRINFLRIPDTESEEDTDDEATLFPEMQESDESIELNEISLECIKCTCKCRIWPTRYCSHRHGEINWKKENFVCYLCEVLERADLEEKIMSLEDGKLDTFGSVTSCPLCTENSDFNVGEHLESVHGILMTMMYKDFEFDCKHCDIKFMDFEEFISHVATVEHASNCISYD